MKKDNCNCLSPFEWQSEFLPTTGLRRETGPGPQALFFNTGTSRPRRVTQLFLSQSPIHRYEYIIILLFFYLIKEGWNLYKINIKYLFTRFYLFIFREGVREGDREGTSNVWLPLMPSTGNSSQACALTGNRTSNSLVCSLALNPLSHNSQGNIKYLLRRLIYRRKY